MDTSRNSRRLVVEDYYKSMSHLCNGSVDSFLLRVNDNYVDLMGCAKRDIMGNSWSMISFSTVAKRLYEWLENEYNNCSEPQYKNAYTSSNFIAVMKRILSLELLLIQYDICTRPRFTSSVERDFFISYANNQINSYHAKMGILRQQILYPIDLFEEVYNKMQDAIKDITPDKLEDCYKKYIVDKTDIYF